MAEDPNAPVPRDRRTLTGFDIAALWFGAAIVISECWAGGLPPLAGLGLGLGLVAILLGRLVGNGLMGAMGAMGAETGLPTMVLTRPAFGVRGSLLPAVLNVAQLVGWTAWMYYVAFLYLDQLAVAVGLPPAADQPALAWIWIAVLALLCTLASYAGAEAWHRVVKYLAGGMLALTVWMTVLVLARYSPAEVFGRGARADASLLSGTDLVIAMSVSWLPLVADYSRFAKTRRGGSHGVFWGYLLGGSWMYAVGLIVAVAVGTQSPDQIVVRTMAEAGLLPVFLGLALVLVSTVTTTFLDIYSAVVSAQNVLPRLPARPAVAVVGLGSALLAGGLDVFSFEPFLLAIGAVFLPVFTVVLVEHYLLSGRQVETSEIDRPGGRYWYTGGVSLRAVAAWAAGFLVFDLAKGWPSLGTLGLPLSGEAWSTGASLPAIGVTAVVYLALSALRPRVAKQP